MAFFAPNLSPYISNFPLPKGFEAQTGKPMHFQNQVRFALLILPLALTPALAQQSQSTQNPPVIMAQMSTKIAKPGTTSTATNSTSTTAQPKQEPCWQVAGVSKQAIDQKHSVELNAKSQISEVCADTSLSQQQKSEKIKEIHQQVKEQTSGLITAQQQESIKECSASRSKGAPVAAAPHPTHTGPCGEATPAPAATSSLH